MDRSSVRGNLKLLILSLLEGEAQYGLQLAKTINAMIDDGTVLSYGSLYPALHSLEHDGFIEGVERPSAEGGRPIREYRLTGTGLEHLGQLKRAQREFQSVLFQLWRES
jgi:PadR family transcriptional regulator, regulatory protein PadR